MSDVSEATAAGDAVVEHEEPLDRLPRVGLVRVIVIVAAAAFLAASVGYLIGHGRAPGAGSVDVGFYKDMTAHHEQAVRMALIELEQGEDPTVRSFAQEVVLFQRWELGRMYEQLDQWGASPRPEETAMRWMGMPVPAEQMPGLATEAQIQALQEAEGADADSMFLDLMAEHHRGGIHMASYAADHAGDADVRDLAGTMARNQAAEIDEYRQAAERLGYDIEIEPAAIPPDDS